MQLRRSARDVLALLAGCLLLVMLLRWNAEGTPLSFAARAHGMAKPPTQANQAVEHPEPDPSNPPTQVDSIGTYPVAATRISSVDARETSITCAGELNDTRQFALGMIETGNEDGAVGRLGEVSRYQIMPSVWKHYSTSRNYRNPEVSAEVARLHWSTLYDYFKKQTEREPTDFDMYVLWNTRHGYYASRGFSPPQLNSTIRDRAQRFANLVADGLRNGSAFAMATRR
jgi:hypothetical protein